MRLNVRVSTLRAVTSVWGGHLLLKNGRAVDCSRSSCQANVHGAQLAAHSVCSGLSASRHEPSGALTLWMDQLVCYWQGNGPSISSLSSFFLLTQGPSEKCIGWTLKQIIHRLADSSVATLPNQTKHREERNGSWIRSAECWMQCAVVNVVKGGGGGGQDLRASQPCPQSLSGQLVLQSQFCHVLLATKRGRKNGRLLLTGDPVAVTRVAGIRAPSSSIFD